MSRRVAVGSLLHESNTFTPVRTDLDAFRRMQYLRGREITDFHGGKHTEIGGMLRTLSEGGAEAVPVLCAWAMPSGIVKRDTYLALKGELLEGITQARMSLDGVLLALHGSMTVEGFDDPEGDVLSAIRAVLPGCPIGVTLDHHANVSPLMAQSADFLIGYRTHPHIDQYQVGLAAGSLIVRLMEEKPALAKHFIKLPLVTPAENRSEPIRKLAKVIEEVEKDSEILTASFFVGFPWANVPRIGASALVVSLQGSRYAEDYARRIADEIWSLRREFQFPLYSPAEALALRTGIEGEPLVMDELCDCTLGGASGDVMTTARYLMDNNVHDAVVAGVVDPVSATRACEAGVGSRVHLFVGGRIFTENNPPLELDATVLFSGENVASNAGVHVGYDARLGKVAVVQSRGVRFVLIEYPGKLDGAAFLALVGIDAKRVRVIVTKEGLNPFITYRGVSSRIVMLDSPGFNRQRLLSKDYTRAPRPMYPLDADMEWHA